MGWGRAKLAPDAARPARYGQWSVLLGGVAFGVTLLTLLIVTSVTVEPNGVPTDAGFAVFLAIFLVAAPIAHIVGIVLGFVGLVRPGGKVMPVVGILLNIAMIGIGAFFAWIVMTAGAAFT